jgi:hypothetical protein
MNKKITVDVVDEVEISKTLDLCDLIDENFDEDELLEYVNHRAPYWHINRLDAARTSVTSEALQVLCGREDFIKELAYLVFHGDIDKQKLLDELNRV